MLAVVQRVASARVVVEDQVIGEVGRGLAVLLAVEVGDDEAKARWMADKLAGLRIFASPDDAKPFDRDVRQVGGGILLVSNFTVAGDCAKGRRPSLDAAAKPGEAQPIFDQVADLLRAAEVPVATGRFGADMTVTIANDGPVTFTLRSPR